jgi:PhzF family phenazine biosynthesis protein
MKIPMFIVDAFTNRLFSGNPAAVCLLDAWPDDGLLKNIAAENNLSETAFLVKNARYYDLRWFTPEIEIDLCGHATLASAYVLMDIMKTVECAVDFHTKSGVLRVEKQNEVLTMSFPSRKASPDIISPELIEGLGAAPCEVLRSRDILAIFTSEEQIRNLTPDFAKLSQVKDCTGIIVSAKGESVDFVSRFFAPNAGINEDPVTGSSHCTLIPYWAEKLGKIKLNALQVSKRGGELFCEDCGETVKISGNAVLYARSEIFIGDGE